MLNRFISGQLRRPSGAFGRAVMTRLLDGGNRELIEATLVRLELDADTSYLDVGFGGGAAIRLASETVRRGLLYGSDFSVDVVKAGYRRLRPLLRTGRLSLVVADISAMPLRDALVDRISTMNTIYFWPAPEVAAQELRRLLRPSGKLAIGYTGAEKMGTFSWITDEFTHWAPEDVESLLAGAGFVDVQTDALAGKTTTGDFVTTARAP